MSIEVSVSFVTNEEIKNINSDLEVLIKKRMCFLFQWILNFQKKVCLLFLGDSIISTEKSIEQAQEFGHSIDRERNFYTWFVIQWLHLLGYDHIERESDNRIITLEIRKETMKLMEVFKNEKEF